MSPGFKNSPRFLAQKMKLAVVSCVKLTKIMKPHSFPKTGQKPVFLRKKTVRKYYETSKNSEVVSQKR